MDATDLEFRARTQSAAIPPALVERLLELGHEEEVRHQAARGEWRCAQGLVRLFGERGLRTQALEVLAPYVTAGPTRCAAPPVRDAFRYVWPPSHRASPNQP